jgi:hypothetical protein
MIRIQSDIRYIEFEFYKFLVNLYLNHTKLDANPIYLTPLVRGLERAGVIVYLFVGSCGSDTFGRIYDWVPRAHIAQVPLINQCQIVNAYIYKI